jgi:hypothetical protein
MKNMIAKLKALGFKNLVLQHGEKLGFGFAALLVLVFLGMTKWSGFAGTPEEMISKAEDVERQLAANAWPQEKRQQFGIVTAEAELARVLGGVEVARFDYRVPMSPKLHARQLPAEEPKLMVVEGLRAVRGNIAMSVYPPEPEIPADGADAAGLAASATGVGGPGLPGTAAQPRRPARRGRNSAMMDPMGMSMDPMGMGSMMMQGMEDAMMGAMSGYASAGLDTRGVRFVCITGSVDTRKQLENIHKAKHLETVSQAAQHLEYVAFKIQRQRAIRGPNPWAGEWKDLDINNSLNVLTNEAAEWDIDIVAGDYINEVFTSPLPQRLNGYWAAAEVGHPDVPTLTEEEAIQEAALLSAAALEAGSAGAEEIRTKGGFAGAQVNAGRLRRQAMSTGDSTGMMDRYNRYMSAAMGGMGMGAGAVPGMGFIENDSAGMGRRGGTRGSSMDMGMGSMGMMGMEGMGGMGGMAAFADVQLFRYFDFEVEPGECYRYRVQLEIFNPNFAEVRVVQPEVAQGETRLTDWSEPSPPVAVERDAEFFLTEVPRRGRNRDSAKLSMYQWNPEVGTTANGTVTPHFGHLVGGTAKTKLFDIAVPSEVEQDVKFLSKEILLDGVPSPVGNEHRSLHGDLNLSPREWGELVNTGKLDTAVTINRFGEFERVDPAAGNKQVSVAKGRMDKEREPYRDMLDAAAAMATVDAGAEGLEAFAGGMDDMGMMSRGKKKKSRISNPLRNLGSMGMQMGTDMGMPGAGPPGMSPPRGTGRPRATPPRSPN